MSQENVTCKIFELPKLKVVIINRQDIEAYFKSAPPVKH